MSTDPENPANTSSNGRGANDGGPLRDRSERSAAAAETAGTVPADGRRVEDTGTRVSDAASASAADQGQVPGRHTGSHAGSYATDPDGGRNDTRAVPAAEMRNDSTAGEDTSTRAVPTHTTGEDTRTRAVPTHTAGEDTSTRVAPVTASRDLPGDSGGDRRAHRTAEDGDARNARNDRHSDGVAGDAALPNRDALLALEKERFGGMKFGSAFFGWLTATGMVVLLTALAAAIGAAINLSAETDLGAALESAAANQSAGIIGAVIMLAVLLLSYFAGGYVAGRMARFNGLKQGLAVWLWALIAAAVVIILGLIYGSDIRSISQLNSVAPLPEDLNNVSPGTWIAVAASLVVTLLGAVLGGLAGMRFHRRIDRADFRTEDTVTR
ncbi:TIGR04086 family membrane protein [Arthrobacter zhangbolii]|uniref:TIGR04086 family membrane protein n=1 Tax=Arthrobacter zhangbolii TaxID=2886936 RepID=A0A9X1M8I9_9MICC|nr:MULTISPECIES: TIGR04086 family membrane protein [Arthrobacter]MCC3272299.1 TIGR04086 family membrane protein [Arthrobacter zhangbolii]MDN3903363.1 TIGR04086 family membrane protein [Arthrobacter sp. YD2]UON91836.1 TIGR04086 family membrane protein [Arthrobacter zhangbolii]